MVALVVPARAGVNEKKCREIVRERSQRVCECCCAARPLTMHHRKKRSQGGLWTPENIVAVCGDGTRGCHGWFEHYPDHAHSRGWHVRPWEDPATSPLLWRGSTWVLLTSEGGTKRVEVDDERTLDRRDGGYVNGVPTYSRNIVRIRG